MLSPDEIESAANFVQESHPHNEKTDHTFSIKALGIWLHEITRPILNTLKSFFARAPLHKHTYIACPKCDWHPQTTDYWSCSCQSRWNVFAEHGMCPVCGRVWTQVQCLKCNQWSDQEDWQHFDDDLTVEDVLAHPEHIVAHRHKIS